MLLKDADEDFRAKQGVSLLDSHDVWAKIAADPLLEGAWDRYTKEAAKGAGKGSGLPDALSRMVDALEHKPKISWRQVLHDYIQYDGSDYVFSPPDRRFSDEFILPSFKESVCGSKLENIWYAVDTSGSVNVREIAEAFGEIKSSIEQIENVEGYVSFFDCEITDPIPFDKIEDIDSMIPVGGGGTSFEVIFEYLDNKLKDNLPRVIVIITDGYADFPEESKALDVPVIWLIVDSEINPPFGESIHIYTGSRAF